MELACLQDWCYNREATLRWEGGRAGTKGLLRISVQEFGRQRLSWPRRPLLPPAVLGSSREASVFSHRGRRELQLKVLVLEDAVESKATLGACKWPTAVTAAVLGEFCKESQPRTSSVEPAELLEGLDLLGIQSRF